MRWFPFIREDAGTQVAGFFLCTGAGLVRLPPPCVGCCDVGCISMTRFMQTHRHDCFGEEDECRRRGFVSKPCPDRFPGPGGADNFRCRSSQCPRPRPSSPHHLFFCKMSFSTGRERKKTQGRPRRGREGTGTGFQFTDLIVAAEKPVMCQHRLERIERVRNQPKACVYGANAPPPKLESS